MPPQGAKHAKHNKRKAAAARQGRQAGQGKRKVVERDTDVFKRRKFIKNNHVESEKEDEESSEEEEVQHTNYGKLLQVFGGSGDAVKAAIDSEDDEDDEDDDSEDECDHNGVAEEDNLAVDDGLEEGLEDSDLEVDGEEEGDISDLSDGAEDSDQNDEGGGSEHDEENVHEEKSDDDEGGDEEGEEGEEGGKDGEAGGDPFSSHVDTTLSAELVKVLGARSWRSSSLALPGVGRVQVQVPAAPGEQAVPAARALDEMGLKEKVAAAVGELGERPRALLSVMASYQDLCYTERAQAEGEELRRAYCAHALNHMLKTRAKILQNNQKHEAREAGEDRLRDQGFTRPKVLIIVPFKEAARRVVETLISLLFPDGTKGNVSNRKRFDQDYRKVVTNRKDKPDDYYDTFEGDLDDSFKLGLAVTKNSLKLYTDFYNSDILVSSPLGLRLVTGLEGEEGEGRREEGDTDFLSSIELVVVDQADVLLMSNWDHLATVVDQLNLQPKESHGVDFGRVRLWSLDGQARWVVARIHLHLRLHLHLHLHLHPHPHLHLHLQVALHPCRRDTDVTKLLADLHKLKRGEKLATPTRTAREEREEEAVAEVGVQEQEVEEEVVARRERQVETFKASADYRAYLAAVPRKQRSRRMPSTPERRRRCGGEVWLWWC